ncbi:DUF192 domain-containing protein [Patescibacteria group bacterium]|nr:DUF192 domain-containing protein [Patescibacteria group bacterium]
MVQPIPTVTISDKTWAVDIANTQEEIQAGLSGWPSLFLNHGMLFDLGSDLTVTITTLQMLFSLDIIFFNSSGVVTEIMYGLAPGNTEPSAIPARFFLEVNAGEAEGVVAGDYVVINDYDIPSTPSIFEGLIMATIPVMVLGLMIKAIKDYSK